MSVPDYTLVVGVDGYHLQQLALTWPTWKRHKPSLLCSPMLMFFDREQVDRSAIRQVVDHPNLRLVPWPHDGVVYERVSADRFGAPQRHKMLTGFAYVAKLHVETPYWLKLDTDVVAIGCNEWIDANWFVEEPVLIGSPWGYTRPPDQMMFIDEWVAKKREALAKVSAVLVEKSPLNLRPLPGADVLRHKRIMGWCMFVRTEFSTLCCKLAEAGCGPFKMPVPSLDGYFWYVAKRIGLPILTVKMSRRGWQQWRTMHNIVVHVKKALG